MAARHSGLVAATYLARAGYGVSIFEARDELGGAVANNEVFEKGSPSGSPASLSALLPNSIIEELGLRLELRSRQVRSYMTQLAFSLSARKDVRRATRSMR